jgi:hypothetical protein
MQFPRWRYHRTESARVFESLEELEVAGEGWYESPKAAAAAIREEQQIVAEPQQAFAPVKKGRNKK